MKKALKIISYCMLLIMILSCSSCSRSVDLTNAKRKNIALILKMNYGYHWSTVKLGADAAAREFNVDLDYAAPDDEEDVEGQIKMVSDKLNNRDKKVDALVLAASDYKALSGVAEKAHDMGIPVIIIDSEVDTKKIDSCIASDNINAGRKAGNMVISIAGKYSNIAIMSFAKGTRDAEEREEGLMNVLSKYPGIRIVAKEYCFSDSRLAYNLTQNIISQYGQIDAIVALNEMASVGAAQAIDEMGLGGKVKIIAFDSTTQEINYLEKGVIQALVIQNPFSMGYLGVKYAVDKLEGREIKELYPIETKVIDKDTMYLPENQRLLFPFVR